jgi:hypothetical protein
MTLKEIYEIEPALNELEREVRDSRGKRRSHRTGLWYQRFKPQLCKLVGFCAQDPRLATCEAYDAVYDHLISLLE